MRKSAAFATWGLLACLACGAHAQLPPPLFYYNFDSVADGVLADLSGRGNAGMLTGNAALTADNAGHPHNSTGKAIEFAADGDSVNVITAPDGALNSLMENDTATVSYWLNGTPEAQPRDQWTFLATDPGGIRQISAAAPWGDGVIYFDVNGCCGANQRIQRAPEEAEFEGQWTHFAYVKDKTVTSMYINGELFHSSHDYTDRDGVAQTGQGGDKAPIGEIVSFRIGSDQNGGSTHIGLFDDFALWDTALPPGRIAELAAGGDVILDILEGDFNDDGVVNVADFNILAMNLGAHFSAPVTYSQGDMNFSGEVDLFDFDGFKDAFPAVVAAAMGIPEPASVVLVVLAIGALLPLGLRR